MYSYVHEYTTYMQHHSYMIALVTQSLVWPYLFSFVLTQTASDKFYKRTICNYLLSKVSTLVCRITRCHSSRAKQITCNYLLFSQKCHPIMSGHDISLIMCQAAGSTNEQLAKTFYFLIMCQAAGSTNEQLANTFYFLIMCQVAYFLIMCQAVNSTNEQLANTFYFLIICQAAGFTNEQLANTLYFLIMCQATGSTNKQLANTFYFLIMCQAAGSTNEQLANTF